MGKSKLSSKKRKLKINLVFDEEKRREFLSGFHKRKLQRKKDAKMKLAKQLQEERKRLKAEAKESYKKLVRSYTAVPEVEHLLAEEYEDEDVNVKVIELSTNEIAKHNNWIGANQPLYTDEEPSTKSVEVNSDEDVPGMHIKVKSKPRDKFNDCSNKTKAQIKNIVKKHATKNVQNSKPFKMKSKLEGQKQRKKSNKIKHMKIKLQNKKNKKRGFRERPTSQR